MKRWKVILAATLIFATGAATGALAFRMATRNTAKSRDWGFPPSMMDGRFDFLGRLKRDLDLTESQSNRIDAILQEGRKRNRQIWETVQPQLREESKQVRERIQAELNPEQRVKYDEIMKRSRERRGPRPEGPGGGPDGGWRRGPRGGTNPPPDRPGEHGAPPPGPTLVPSESAGPAPLRPDAPHH